MATGLRGYSKPLVRSAFKLCSRMPAAPGAAAFSGRDACGERALSAAALWGRHAWAVSSTVPGEAPPSDTVAALHLGRSAGWQHRYNSGHASQPPSNVRSVASDAELAQALQEARDANKAAVVDFSASWCGPCRQVAPQFDALSAKLDDVAFLKVDIDEEALQGSVADAKVRAVPTFDVHKGGKQVGRVEGADMAKVMELLGKARQQA